MKHDTGVETEVRVALQAFLLLLIAIVMSTTGELLLKRGMNAVGVLSLAPADIVPMLANAFSNPFILAGFALLFGGSIFWLAVISRVDLSWAYPMLSLGYVLVVVNSWLFLDEQVTPIRVAGVAIICLGVAIVGRS
jgi:multidrug transporter EmrE-like cation transporter